MKSHTKSRRVTESHFFESFRPGRHFGDPGRSSCVHRLTR